MAGTKLPRNNQTVVFFFVKLASQNFGVYDSKPARNCERGGKWMYKVELPARGSRQGGVSGDSIEKWTKWSPALSDSGDFAPTTEVTASSSGFSGRETGQGTLVGLATAFGFCAQVVTLGQQLSSAQVTAETKENKGGRR